jgi:integrase
MGGVPFLAHKKITKPFFSGGLSMSASKHQLVASAYHLKPADVQKLLLQANNFRDRCLIKTLWWLGVRRSELINLDVRDFDKKRKRITVRKSKGSKTRVVPQYRSARILLSIALLLDLWLQSGVYKFRFTIFKNTLCLF